MKGGPYKLLNSLRFWRAGCSDDGATSIAEVLRLGGADVKLSYLELLDCNIGPRGANAIGASLSRGHNLSLLTLKLDYNSSLGDEGLDFLCKGLRTNISLKQLHLQCCKLTSDAGVSLQELLANSRSNIEVLNITGNRIEDKGLQIMCRGLIQNTKCTTLILADNAIDYSESVEGVAGLRDCLLCPTVALTKVDL